MKFVIIPLCSEQSTPISNKNETELSGNWPVEVLIQAEQC